MTTDELLELHAKFEAAMDDGDRAGAAARAAMTALWREAEGDDDRPGKARAAAELHVSFSNVARGIDCLGSAIEIATQESSTTRTFLFGELRMVFDAAYRLGQLSVPPVGVEAREIRSRKREARWSVLVTLLQGVLLADGVAPVNSEKFARQVQPKLETAFGEKLTLSEIRKALAEVKLQQSAIRAH